MAAAGPHHAPSSPPRSSVLTRQYVSRAPTSSSTHSTHHSRPASLPPSSLPPFASSTQHATTTRGGEDHEHAPTSRRPGGSQRLPSPPSSQPARPHHASARPPSPPRPAGGPPPGRSDRGLRGCSPCSRAVPCWSGEERSVVLVGNPAGLPGRQDIRRLGVRRPGTRWEVRVGLPRAPHSKLERVSVVAGTLSSLEQHLSRLARGRSFSDPRCSRLLTAGATLPAVTTSALHGGSLVPTRRVRPGDGGETGGEPASL